MKGLLEHYKNNRSEIKDRIQEFREVYKKSDRDIFVELCFCILTPQSDAIRCSAAIKELEKTGLLFHGTARAMSPKLKAARFLNKKAQFLVEARKFFKRNGSFCIKPYLNEQDIFKTREWLVRNISGFGYKEASHFLRNIGLGRDLAILDVHILKNLKRYGVISEIPKSMTGRNYVEIESKMRKFSRKIDIPMEELDLLFWSKETGVVFK